MTSCGQLNMFHSKAGQRRPFDHHATVRQDRVGGSCAEMLIAKCSGVEGNTYRKLSFLHSELAEYGLFMTVKEHAVWSWQSNNPCWNRYCGRQGAQVQKSLHTGVHAGHRHTYILGRMKTWNRPQGWVTPAAKWHCVEICFKDDLRICQKFGSVHLSRRVGSVWSGFWIRFPPSTCENAPLGILWYFVCIRLETWLGQRTSIQNKDTVGHINMKKNEVDLCIRCRHTCGWWFSPPKQVPVSVISQVVEGVLKFYAEPLKKGLPKPHKYKYCNSKADLHDYWSVLSCFCVWILYTRWNVHSCQGRIMTFFFASWRQKPQPPHKSIKWQWNRSTSKFQGGS
jgi:hypothetical protein